jgi:hypothetical protein
VPNLLPLLLLALQPTCNRPCQTLCTYNMRRCNNSRFMILMWSTDQAHRHTHRERENMSNCSSSFLLSCSCSCSCCCCCCLLLLVHVACSLAALQCCLHKTRAAGVVNNESPTMDITDCSCVRLWASSRSGMIEARVLIPMYVLVPRRAV